MTGFLAGDYSGAPFEWLGAAHLGALACLLGLNLYLVHFRAAGLEARNRARWTMALALWINEIAWHAWNLAVGTWTVQTMLPLHLCSLLVWAGGLMLVTRNHTIYEFMYFLGIGAAIQPLATPDLGIYGFPHFRFFQTFISHGLIVTSAVYMTTVEGFRPNWRSMLKVALWGNIYAVAVFFVNSAIGSNYLMINAKPGTPSLLDLLPPWPYYLIFMEAIGIVTFLLLYMPFALKNRRRVAGTPA